MRAQRSGRRSSLPPELARWADLIEVEARARGLDFHPVVFELLDAKDVNGIAAFGGFPVRYPSWRFGMEFERLEKGYEWGLSKIYELVINNDPVVAYLVRSNSALEQKLVMAHVFGHADFFKHNCWFASTDRRMLDSMANHGARVRAWIDRQGLEAVERFLDEALSIETLIDPYLPLRERLSGRPSAPRGKAPTYDVLGFLLERAPLEPWQRDCLAIVREEATYFQPQRMTKIMNEGWATFWHSRVLTSGVLDASEIVDFADCHSGATASAAGRINPYKLGLELFRWAEEQGQDLFRLRRVHDDASFIDELVDEAFVERQAMYLFGRNQRSQRYELADRDWKKVKERLLADLAWGGLPRIELVAVDAAGHNELSLVHHHDGRDLELAAAKETLLRLSAVWRGRAELTTREDGEGRRLIACNGEIELIELGKEGEPKSGEGEAH